jgi:hypothetical protein
VALKSRQANQAALLVACAHSIKEKAIAMQRPRHPIRAIREPFGKAGLTVAILALVLAMVGGAYAAGALTRKQKKEVVKIAKRYAGKDGLAGAQGKEGKQGPTGQEGPPGPSTGPASGDLTGSYPGPQIAPDAVTSGKIADGAVTSTDLAPTENVHSVTLNNCVGATKWTGAPGFARQPGFWMDPTGLVHLQGAVSCSGDATEGGAIFSLPAGYQPHLNGGVVRFGVLGGGAVLVQIGILDDNSGNVVYDGPNGTTIDDYISLDGITFRP